MIRNSRLVLISSLVVPLWLTPGHARAQAAPPAAAGQATRPPDFKIAYWYQHNDPLNTFHFRAYDLRKGQYTEAVDRWLRTMQAEYPHYDAYVKDLRLKADGGLDEGKQLATAVLQENLAKGGPNGGFGIRDAYGIYGAGGLGHLLGAGRVRERPMPGPRYDDSRYYRGYGFIESPGANRTPGFLASPNQATPGIPSPFPFPYVRPHP